ncbi:MAG TPA: alpha/beta fold hydrolase [Acidimicrobiales bacterium]
MPLPRVVLVHGFTQTGRSWPPAIVERLEHDGHEVLAVDVPGHGSASHVRADLREGARLLAIRGHADYVGYSLGGRLALHVAVYHPESVRRLVLIGATPGIEDAAERRAREKADHALATTIQRDGVDEFLTTWLANPLFASLPADAAGVEARLENTPSGLASSLRLMGTGAQTPLWEFLPRLTMPALFIVGELDPKFSEIALRMAGEWGGPASVEVIPNAGHAVHLERPDAVADAIASFLHASTSAAASSAP